MKARPSRHPLTAATRGKLVDLLNARLADLGDLRSQVKQAHWSLRGPRFIALHELFDKMAGELDVLIDEVAERATALGGRALGTARLTAEHSKLPEFPAKASADLEIVAILADRYGKTTGLTLAAVDKAEDLGDKVTGDLFIRITGELDKNLWFLESHLDG